jgi:hypothetical protein
MTHYPALLFVVAFALSTLGCESKIPRSNTTCQQVCAHLRAMSCETGHPTPAGVPCEKWLCEAAASARNEEASVKLDCIIAATSCEEAERVQVKGCR